MDTDKNQLDIEQYQDLQPGLYSVSVVLQDINADRSQSSTYVITVEIEAPHVNEFGFTQEEIVQPPTFYINNIDSLGAVDVHFSTKLVPP